ncbi:MAG: cache domain-containing protein, partial [Chloroflexi bacterium]|nr:cache domain-containing protein [Chloroflexota bacterium]
MKLASTLFALSAIILVGAIYFTDANLRASARENAQRDLSARAKNLADAIDRNLQARLIQTLTFAALPSLRGFAASDETGRASRTAIAQNELQAFVAADPNLRAAFILDAAGSVVLATDETMRASFAERLFFRAAMSGQLFASAPAKDFGEVSQYYSAPLIDNAGNVAGVLVLRVAVQEFWNGIGKNEMVVDENGILIADGSDKPQTFFALAPIAGETYNQLIAERRYGAEQGALRFSNRAALASFSKVDNAGGFVFSDANTPTTFGATRRLQTNFW